MDVEDIQPGNEDMAASDLGLSSILFPTASHPTASGVMGGAVGGGRGTLGGPEQAFRKESSTEMEDRPLVADLWPDDGSVVSLTSDLYVRMI
jgi:hypothetical protein